MVPKKNAAAYGDQVRAPIHTFRSLQNDRLCGQFKILRTNPLNNPKSYVYEQCACHRKRRTSTTTQIRAAAAPLAVAPALCHTGWPLWSAMAVCAALSQVIERRTTLGTYLSAPLLATLLALGAAAAGIIPTTAQVYETIWSYLLPLAAALYLLECDISRVFSTSGQAIIAFVNGAAGTVLGTMVAYALVGRFLGPDGSKVAAALCAR